MKLLLNENIGRTTTRFLRRRGHDVLWIGEGFAGTDDASVLAKARREGRILVTKDKDFGELAFKARLSHHGIILLRLLNETPRNTVRVLDGVLRGLIGQRLPFFVVASESGYRIRRTD